ncbi:MAG: DUF1501 domain-containing protein [Myxococcota bacterium]
MFTLTRRAWMKGVAAAIGAAAVTPARGASDTTRRLIVVFANGGWDPLTVFAPIFGSPYVDANTGGALGQVGDLSFVDHPDRPSVRALFEAWRDRAAIVNGISVPSLSHEVCTRLVYTGQTVDGRADWGATVGADQPAAYTLPNLVISGPSFPSAYGATTARTGLNGQLAQLTDGTILSVRDQGEPLSDAVRGLIAERTRQRARAFAAAEPALGEAFDAARRRAATLTSTDGLDLGSTRYAWDRAALAVDALAQGVSRVVTFDDDGGWDTHATNDPSQSALFEGLFQLLGELVMQLDSAGLLDLTTVAVVSEMGRTPRWNADAGRDHWPYTSALLLGGPVRGNRVISGFDEGYYPLGYDPVTGETTPAGAPLTTEHLGATLLALCDLDPADHLPAEVAPIASVLA